MKNDKKNLRTLFILTIACLIILCISIIIAINNSNYKNTLEVEINKNNEIINLIDIDLNPGEEVTYKVKTNAKKNSNLEVEIWFENVEQKNYELIDVYVNYDTYTTKKDKIEKYNIDNKLKFNYYFEDRTESFDLVFSLSKNIGNEGQNLSSEFKTIIKIENY